MSARRRTAPAVVTRNNARTRWFHAAVYVTVLVLMFTGWWLTLGQEGRPSFVSRLVDEPDAEIHTVVGRVFAGLVLVGILLGWRAARTVLTDSVRFRRSDLRWFARLPLAALTGRFRRHEGHFDPGQRIANLLIVALLLVLIVTGLGLDYVSGGPAFVWYNKIHKWATYAFTGVIAVHILVASGVLPGYRGVWRAMHFGGHLREKVAARIWPAWLERHQRAELRTGRTSEPMPALDGMEVIDNESDPHR